MDGIMIELILWSEDPEVPIDHICQSIDIFPVEKELLGDIKFYGKSKQLKRYVDISSLMYSTGYVDTIDVETALNRMVDIIEPKMHIIESLVKQYDLNVKLCVVIKLAQKPVISIPSSIIHILGKLSAEIEFDSYLTNDSIWHYIKPFQWFIRKGAKQRKW